MKKHAAFPMLRPFGHNADWDVDHGMSMREYSAAHAPITLQDAIIAAGYEHEPEGDILCKDDFRAVIMTTMAVMREEYAAAMIFMMVGAAKPTEGSAKHTKGAANSEPITAKPAAKPSEGSKIDVTTTVLTEQMVNALAGVLASFKVPGEYEGYPGEAERLVIRFCQQLAKYDLSVTSSSAQAERISYLSGYEAGAKAMQKAAVDTIENTRIQYNSFTTGALLESLKKSIADTGVMDLDA